MADSRVRFGIFDFDPVNRELSRNGVPMRLQAQPAQALAMLIAHAGEVVTRDALKSGIWGNETFVDFDRNINFCIAQIRTALGDSAESPQYIRTLPKRGYQFIAPVSQKEQAIAPRKRRVPAAATAAIAAGGLAILGVLYWAALRPHSPTIAVTRFDNETGDPAFTQLADSLTDGVVAELTQAAHGRYAVIGNAAILRRPREVRDLAAIGAALHTEYIVLGQVQRSGGGIRILSHLIHLPDQKHLWVTRADLPSGQVVGRAADLPQRISAEFLVHLAASLPSSSR